LFGGRPRGGPQARGPLRTLSYTCNTKEISVTLDTTIRNLNEDAYRQLKARAALEGRPIGEVLSDLIRQAAGTGAAWPKRGSAHDIRPQPFGKKNRRLSEEIDAIVYGI